MAKVKAPALPTEVAKLYKLRGIKAGAYDFHKVGVVDLTKLTVARAAKLIAGGFPYLVEKAVAAASK